MAIPERERPWSPWRYLRMRHPEVVVYETELAGDMLGCVALPQGPVWLDCRLTQAEKRSTLAHELGHLERGSLCDPASESVEERQVEEWAARRLIDVHNLARAIAWSCHIDEIAEELWVDEHMVRARFRALTDEEQDVIFQAIDNRGRVA